MGFTRAKVKMPLLCVVDLKAYTYAVQKNFFKNSSRIVKLFVEFSVHRIEVQKFNEKIGVKKWKIVEHFCGNCIYISERKTMEKQITENKKEKMEAGFAVNKNAFYKEVV